MTKPKFDPTASFDVVESASAKPKFDPNAPFDSDALETHVPSVSPVSDLEAVTRGLGQGSTLGYADELAGLGQKTGSLIARLMAGNNLNDQSKAEYDAKPVYQEGRDEYRAADAAVKAGNPNMFNAGQFAGAVGSGVLTGGTSIPAMGGLGAVQGLGSSQADLTQGDVSGAALDTAIGGGVGLGAGALGSAASAIASKVPLSKIPEAISRYLGEGAEKLAVNATGATGRQAEKFSADAGRELLDRGLVKFGDTAGNIAKRAGETLDESTGSISSVLRGLDDQGVKVSNDEVVNQLEQQIAKLQKDPSKATLVKQLKSTINDIIEAGQSKVPVSEAEGIKRGFQSKVNWNTPETNPLNATVSDAYKKAVESTAEAADPALAKEFLDAKKTFGLVKPIQEAAERRAASMNQSAFGGLSDMVAGGVGSVAGLPGAAASILMKRNIAPRLASSGAVVADQLAKVIESTPEVMGKFSSALKNAALKGGNSLAVTDYVLSKQHPEYRQMKQDAFRGLSQEASHSVTKQSTEQLQESAIKADERGHKDLAKAIGSMEEKDPTGRNAVLFTILQNPKQRKQYEELNDPEVDLSGDVDTDKDQ